MSQVRLPDLRPAAGPAGLDRRTALALDISSWIALVVMGSLGIAVLDGVLPRIVAAVLCLGYGALDLAGGRTELGARRPVLVIGLQTAVVTALLALHPEFQETFAFLFFVLSVRVVVVAGLRRGAWWIGLFWVISGAAALWTHGSDGAFSLLFNLGVYPLCGLVGYALAALGRSTAERAAALTELRQAQDQLRRVAVDEERRRLGRDLHDSVKQQVFAATMQLGAARALLPGDPDRALGAVERAEQAARTAGSELSLVIHELRSQDLDHGLPTALTELADSWSRQLDVTVDCQVDDRLSVPLPEAYGLLRVAQESLANISRHAEARRVTLSLTATPGNAEDPAGIELIVSDDGRGFDTVRAGVGISSMQERMTALGGSVTISSTPGTGTRVCACLPQGVGLPQGVDRG